MRDGVEFFAMKELVDRTAVPQIDSMDRDIAGDGGHVGALDLRVVKIVEIVEDRDFVSACEQLLDEMRTNETRAARDQNSHRASVKMKPIASKGRTRLSWMLLLAGLFLLALAADVVFRLESELRRPQLPHGGSPRGPNRLNG